MTPEFIAEREELFGRPLTQEERHRVAQDAYRHARDNVMEDPEAFGVTLVSNTKYDSYQLPGGENYREHLLTLPEKAPVRDHDSAVARAKEHYESFPQYGPGSWDKLTEAQQRPYIEAAAEGKMKLAGGNYRSSHWDEPNVLAHVRTNDREVGGKPSMHLEEIQSDWHQAGRKRGYKGYTSRPSAPVVPQELQAIVDRMLPGQEGRHLDTIGPVTIEHNVGGTVTRAEADRLLQWQRENQHQPQSWGNVPDAPFKTSWTELALKRMIRMAAEEGKDRISWTPGEAQAARYDLSKQVRSLSYQKNNNGMYKLSAEMPDRRGQMIGDAIPADKLADHVGKEIAEKIIKGEGENVNMAANNSPRNEWNRLSGVNLKVGGEGMKGFYDDILPKTIEKMGKKYGVKVHKGETGTKGISKTVDDRYSVTGDSRIFDTLDEAKKAASQPVYYFDIPPAWKDQALSKGFPLFTSGIPFPLTPVDYNPFTNKDAM
jgi:hypothetical protein